MNFSRLPTFFVILLIGCPGLLLAPENTEVAFAAQSPVWYVVFAGKIEGEDVLVSCKNMSVNFTVQAFPYGGGLIKVASEGTHPCTEKYLTSIYPNTSQKFFKNPTHGWTVAEDERSAAKCNKIGSLITVSTQPSGYPTIEEEQDSLKCKLRFA